MRDIGIQLERTNTLGITNTHVLDYGDIMDVFIHEAIIHWQIRYYLAVVLKHQTSFVVLFEASFDHNYVGV